MSPYTHKTIKAPIQHKMATKHIFLALVLLIAARSSFAQHCRPFGHFVGTNPPEGKCNPSVSDCCVEGKVYSAYHCSPPVSSEGETRAILTLNDFEVGGPTACDSLFHSDEEPVVALPTGWYGAGKRCGREIVIKTLQGNIARARVVDHCDSAWGCDEAHRYKAPCRHNVVDASMAVWRELGVPQQDWKELNVTWAEV